MKSFAKPSVILSTLLGLTTLLVACGGGGGGTAAVSPNAPSLSISAANQDAVALEVVSTTFGSGTTGATGAETAAISDIAFNKRIQADVKDFFSRPRSSASEVATGVAYSDPPVACPYGGTKTTSGNYASASTSTVNDYDTITYSNCRLTASSVANGSLTITITAYSKSSQYVYSGGISIAYNNLSLAVTSGTSTLSVSQNGTVAGTQTRTSSTNEALTISTPSMSITATYNGTASNRTLLDYTGTIATTKPGSYYLENTTTSGVLSSTALSASKVSFSTQSPFAMYPEYQDYPQSGVMLIKGKTGTMRVTALNSTQVKIELDAGDDGTYESSKTVAWSSLN